MVEKRYIFECKSCTECPNIESYEHKRIEERITPLQYNMIEKFTNKKYSKMYKDRFAISEGINGFIKSTNGVFKLISSHKKKQQIMKYCYKTQYINIIRTINLKGTAY